MRLYLCLFLILIHTVSAFNNVCKSLEDYYTIQNNPNCWYDYITDLELPEILNVSGRPAEFHKVITHDGHILPLFRISNSASIGKKASPVFLQHGLSCSAKNWVSLGNDSLAFQLHNEGYDVWIGNFRGSQYSVEHVNLTDKDEAYWDYNIDHLSLIDLPAMLNKVVETTGTRGNIIFVGHSLGATMGLIYASQFPTEAKSLIKAMILLGPPYKSAHTISPILQLSKISRPIWTLFDEQRLWNVVSRFPNIIVRSKCLNSPSSMLTCIKLFGYLYGPRNGLKPSQYPNYLKQQFSRSSIKVFEHVAFSFFIDKFTKFDYGFNNTRIYGSKSPPIYDVSKIEIPTILTMARSDWLTTAEDALRLAKDMNANYMYKVIEINDYNFNHMSYMFGSRTKEVVVDVIVKHIGILNLLKM